MDGGGEGDMMTKQYRSPVMASINDMAESLRAAGVWERDEKHPQGSSLKLLSFVVRRGVGTVA